MSVFTNIAESIKVGAEDAMMSAGEQACKEMRDKLQANGHVDSGELLNSIGYEVKKEGDRVSIDVSIADYYKYIEHGTGAAHGVPNGRKGFWRYKDKNGEWHTTDGMDADPFVQPALDNLANQLSDIISTQIADALQGRGDRGG